MEIKKIVILMIMKYPPIYPMYNQNCNGKFNAGSVTQKACSRLPTFHSTSPTGPVIRGINPVSTLRHRSPFARAQLSCSFVLIGRACRCKFRTSGRVDSYRFSLLTRDRMAKHSELSKLDYATFDSSVYLHQYYGKKSIYTERVKHSLSCYHNAFNGLSSNLKVLDYGCGPVIMNVISAATKASEIILAEYSEQNCKTLQQWINGDPTSFDWSTHFKFVVQELEGKSEEEVRERQDLVRKLVKAVVHCDITQEPPIESGYDDVYDVVVCCLMLEASSRDNEQYAANIARVGKLVKSGGSLLLYGVENTSGFYSVGDYKFSNLHVTAESTMKAVENAGFTVVQVEKLNPFNEQHRIYRFIKAIKQ